jgi:hypothetical protein
MQDQQAVCFEIRNQQPICSGVGFAIWRREARGNRVAAVARAGAKLDNRWMSAPVTDNGLEGAPRAGSALPVLWLVETNWLATIRQSRAPNQGNGRRERLTL